MLENFDTALRVREWPSIKIERPSPNLDETSFLSWESINKQLFYQYLISELIEILCSQHEFFLRDSIVNSVRELEAALTGYASSVEKDISKFLDDSFPFDTPEEKKADIRALFLHGITISTRLLLKAVRTHNGAFSDDSIRLSGLTVKSVTQRLMRLTNAKTLEIETALGCFNMSQEDLGFMFRNDGVLDVTNETASLVNDAMAGDLSLKLAAAGCADFYNGLNSKYIGNLGEVIRTFHKSF